MIVIIRGPSAAGKSTVSKLLGEHFQPSVVINVDELRHWITGSKICDDHIRMGNLGAASTARVFNENDYHVFVDSVFITQNEIDDFIAQLGSEPMFIITLNAKLENLLERDNNLPENLKMGTRVEELYKEYLDSDITGTIEIDTTDKTAREVANIIINDILA